jgi:hypothetical protein
VSEVSRAVRWSVVSAVAEAELTWLDADTPSLHGSGYSDWVVLRRPTRFLGFSSLQWGRARFGDEAFVYGALDFADGRLWRFGLRAAAGRTPLAIPVESVVTGEGRTDVSFGRDGLLALEPLRVLHDGPALDSARFPQAVERALVRAANGAAFETRWVSRARLGDRSGLALHERVSFG